MQAQKNVAILSLSDRLGALSCLAVAALMCGTACFSTVNINLHLLDSKPVTAPASPRASQSASTLKPGGFRVGMSGDGVGISPQNAAGTSTGQMALNARLGVAPKGLELNAGLAIPIIQPFGIVRYQILGQNKESGPFLCAEAGGAIGEAFGGLSLGTNLDKAWELGINGRGGNFYESGYGEAGISLMLHTLAYIDMVSGDVRSVKRSCVHIAHPDGRMIPFDTYNLFYRGDLERTRLEPLRKKADIS